MTILLALSAAAAGQLAIPSVDRSRAIQVAPVNRNVVLCASPNALPLARLAAKSLDSGGPDYGFDKLMEAGGCIQAMTTDPIVADFQEDVKWTGALSPPTTLHGSLRVARVRIDMSKVDPQIFAGIFGYFYAAVDDLRAV